MMAEWGNQTSELEASEGKKRLTRSSLLMDDIRRTAAREGLALLSKPGVFPPGLKFSMRWQL